MEATLSGKVALVTGGGSGLGRAASILFAKRGAKVAVVDRAINVGQETAMIIRDQGGDAIFIQADVSNENEVEGMVRGTIDIYGRLDVALNNAGIRGFVGKLDQVTGEDFDRIIDINLKGVFFSMKYEIRQMQKQCGGVIINMSSAAGHKAAENLSVYSASKAAIISLTNAAAVEYGGDNIRIVAVSPSWIKTHLIIKFMEKKSSAKIQEDSSPLRRFGKPEEVAELVCWLASDAASYISGGNILITGASVI